jgi:hypothetical protein
MVQQNDRGEEIYQPELRRKRCLKDIICLSRVRLLDKVGQEEKFWHVLNIEAPETGDGGCEINGVDLLRFSSNLHVGYGHIFNTYRYGIWIWIWNMDMDYILNMGICWIHIEIHCRLYTRNFAERAPRKAPLRGTCLFLTEKARESCVRRRRRRRRRGEGGGGGGGITREMETRKLKMDERPVTVVCLCNAHNLLKSE